MAGIDDAPVIDSPAAEAPAPEPSIPAAEPSRMDIIRESVAAQKEGREPELLKVERGADGKYIPRKEGPGIDRPAPDRTAPAAAAAPAAPPVAKAGVDQAAPAVVDPNAAPVVRPPPGWSPQSKVAFDTLPESVKADIVKRESEIDKGFARLAEYKGVDKYADMAKRGGTTLDKALEQYTGIETLLRQDVFAGITRVLANVGIKDPSQFVRAWQQRLTPGDQQAPQNQPAPTPAHQTVDPNKIAEQVRSQIKAEQANEALRSEVQRFQADPKNRFYENVKPQMAKLVQAGLAATIQDAYDMACRMDPTIAPLINQPSASNDPAAVRAAAALKARAAAKATIGAPSRASPAASAPDPNMSRRDVIAAAVAAQKGRA
jgi:hypothetical protein